MGTGEDADVVLHSPHVQAKKKRETWMLAYTKYAECVEHFRQMECGILKLMRHPEATDEQILSIKQSYATAHKNLWDAYEKLKASGRLITRPSLTAYHDKK
jgi:hypothetical protein